MNSNVRVRFAPSPTGGLHLGGVRTVLYNYLFARQHKGTFVLRIEDTDQGRYVEGAEQYILDCLNWCGLLPDEGPGIGGDFGPYRQSERKDTYKIYAEQLVNSGYAYYAFDTPEEIEQMRERLKSEGKSSLHYDHHVRRNMKNSLNMSADETLLHLNSGIPYVIRIKIPEDQSLHFEDMIRGRIDFDTSSVDDKVLLKADGMPTYHLAVVVDDYLMKITHAFRGEEWLPSAPVHILLWKYLGWEKHMPQWAHLPLILKPDGNGKLSKRDGDRLGFPVFAMNWLDPKTHELISGFKEMGFLPEAFINMLAVLGWNDGSEQELFDINELIDKFSIKRVHHSGAKFNFEKAKWFNHEWIKKIPFEEIETKINADFISRGLVVNEKEKLREVLNIVKERCTLLTDFYDQSSFFFIEPVSWDISAITPKWNNEKSTFFKDLIGQFKNINDWSVLGLESLFKDMSMSANLKTGELLLPLRIMLVGGKFGPPVFDIAVLLGKNETISRINKVLELLNQSN